jgi:hypothetical protein
MIVVSDASPLIALDSIGQLELLSLLYRQVLIPPRVYDEAQSDRVRAALWLTVVPVEDYSIVEKILAKGLHRGEAEAIGLALQVKAERLIIDERKGRRVAEQFGIHLIGTLRVLVKAKQAGLIDEVRSLVDALIRTIAFRVGSNLYEEILRDCGE